MPKVSMPPPSQGGRRVQPPKNSPYRRPPLVSKAPRGSSNREPRIYPKSPQPTPSIDLRLVGIDPGYTTGMAFRIDGDLHTLVSYNDDDVLKMLKGVQMVVVERFATAGRLSAPGLFTIELVGQIVGWCKALKVPYELATPQARYAFMDYAKSQVGPGKLIERSKVSRHETDALAHLLAWEYRNRQI